MGVKTAIIPYDEITKKYLAGISQQYDIVHADAGAKYAKEITFEASELEPLVSIPHNVDKVSPVSKVGKVAINQAFVGSCANGSLRDLEIIAKILKNKKVARGVRFMVTPASSKVLNEAIKSGAASQIVESGAIIVNPGCSVCCEDGGSLADGEICISSSSRNFLARMGSAQSQIYLGSPATVAASAIKGEITDPREFL
jgi:3-isopropylmalate/(R)-2-methylmalate dehydratase large subunit